MVVAAISDAARELCESQSLSPEQIADVVVVGNMVMHHLLLELPVEHLGAMPFVAAATRAMDVKAPDIGIKAAPGACVHTIANIAGFVGGDHTAMLLAVGIDHEEKTVLALDIGTNTEISLIHRGRLLTISCPSGPALEGGHIRCGMRSARGAIESVEISGDQLCLKMIGNARPVGICGSGVLDATAQLFRAGIVNRTGRMSREHPRVRIRDRQPEFVLADEQETGGTAIVSNQRDVRAVQLAKGAIRAGIQEDPELKGVHIIGGMTNIGNMLPPLKFDGIPLRQLVENAFLTLAVPLGFDTIMGTPWNNFRILPDDNVVLQTLKDFTQLKGLNAIRRVRQLWAPAGTRN